MIALEMLKSGSGLLILTYASLLDWRYREIDDKSWLSLIALGVVFSGYEFLQGTLMLVPLVTSVIFTSILVVALYYLGVINGGDAKVLIGISALIATPYRFTAFPFFSLSVFANAVMLSATLPLFFFLYNIKRIREVKNPKDLIIMLLGYKKRGDNVGKHEAIIAKDGEYNLFLRARNVELGVKTQGEVWVTPAIPFVIMITAGFLISIVFGDIISYILLAIS